MCGAAKPPRAAPTPAPAPAPNAAPASQGTPGDDAAAAAADDGKGDAGDPKAGVPGEAAPANEVPVAEARAAAAARQLVDTVAARLLEVVPTDVVQVTGVWETTLGFVSLTQGAPALAFTLAGEYGTDNGGVAATAYLEDTKWVVRGAYATAGYPQPNALHMSMDAASATGMAKFDISWFRGDSSGEWRAERLSDAAAMKHSSANGAGLAGLVNMDQGLNNVCYQNSLLQALFMTDEFRRRAVSAPLVPRTTADAVVDGGVTLGSWADLVAAVMASSEDAANAVAALIAEVAATAPSGSGGNIEDTPSIEDGAPTHLGSDEHKSGGDDDDLYALGLGVTEPGCAPGDVGNRVQWLLAALALTQRSSVASHALQQVLPRRFRTGRQQDIAEFRTFLMESLSLAFPGRGGQAMMEELFGCDLVTSQECRQCGHRRNTHETTTQVNLSFPTKFTAITDVRVVAVDRPMGKMPQVQTPAGYTRVNFDLNKDRTDSPYIFLCVKRDPAADPITELRLMTADHGKQVKEPPTDFVRLPQDLNEGGKNKGDHIFLCIRREKHRSPITDIRAIDANSPVPDGYRKDATNLNKHGGGATIHLVYQQDYPIRDIKLVQEGVPGYEFIDRNLLPTDTQRLQLAFTHGSPRPPITDLELVPPGDVDAALARGLVHVSTDSIGDHRLMVRRGEGCPITKLDVFRATHVMPKYEGYEWIDVARPRDPPHPDGVWVGESKEYHRRKVIVKQTSYACPAWSVRGTYGDHGIVEGIMYKMRPNPGEVVGPEGPYRFVGQWRDKHNKHGQALELRWAAGKFHGRGCNLNLEYTYDGDRILPHVTVQGNIVEIAVLLGHDPVPDGFELLNKTKSGRTGNLNEMGVPEAKCRLAVRRGFAEPAIAEVGVVLNPGVLEQVPDGWELLARTPSGQPADLNHMTQGPPVMLCFKRVPADAPPAQKRLTDLDIVWGVEPTPSGFSLVKQTVGAVKSAANLNTGTSFSTAMLAVRKTGYIHPPHPDCFINGTYQMPKAIMQLYGICPTQVTTLLGTMDNGRVKMQVAVVPYDAYHPNSTRGGMKGMGFVYPTTQPAVGQIHRRPGRSVSFHISDDWRTMKGAVTSGIERDAWSLFHDDRIRIGFKRDFGTVWRGGQQVHTDRVPGFHLAALLKNFSTPHVMGGPNRVLCENCNTKCENERRVLLARPGEHLMLTVTRMKYDARTAKTVKFLDDVQLMTCIQMPEVPDEIAHTVYRDMSPAQLAAYAKGPGRRYGLYAVIVHTGVTANSGHYFMYGRNSSAPDLHKPDSKWSPWVKFNDTRVTPTTWAELQDATASSVSDTAYVLLYRRLNGVQEPAVPPEVLGGAASVTAGVAPTPGAAAGAGAGGAGAGGDEDEQLRRAMQMSLAAEAAAKNAPESKAPDAPAASLQSSLPAAPVSLPPWLERVLADNAKFLFGVLQKRSSPYLATLYNSLARLNAGLPINADAVGDAAPVGVPATPHDRAAASCGLPTAVCRWCAETFADADSVAVHEAGCNYGVHKPAVCQQCQALAPLDAMTAAGLCPSCGQAPLSATALPPLPAPAAPPTPPAARATVRA